MAVTADASGSTGGTIASEITLRDVAAAGDAVELRVYQMVLTGTTRRCAYFQNFMDAQGGDDTYPRIAVSVPISNELTDAGALRFTMKQTAGTGRIFPWKVLKYA